MAHSLILVVSAPLPNTMASVLIQASYALSWLARKSARKIGAPGLQEKDLIPPLSCSKRDTIYFDDWYCRDSTRRGGLARSFWRLPIPARGGRRALEVRADPRVGGTFKTGPEEWDGRNGTV